MVPPSQQKDQLTYNNLAQFQATFSRDLLPEDQFTKDLIQPDFSGGVIDYSNNLFDQPLNDQDVIYLPMFGGSELDAEYASRRMSEVSTVSNDSSLLGTDLDQFVNSNISDLSTHTSLTASPMTPLTSMHGDGGSPPGTTASGILGPPRTGLGVPAMHSQLALHGGNELRRFSLPTLSHTIPPPPHATSGAAGPSASTTGPSTSTGIAANISSYQFPSPQPVLSAPLHPQEGAVASPPYTVASAASSGGFGTPGFSPSMSSSTTSSSFPVSPAFENVTPIDPGMPQGEVVGANAYVRMPNGTYRSEYVGATSIAQQAQLYNTGSGHHWPGSVCTGNGCCSPFSPGDGTIAPGLVSTYPHFNLLTPPRRQRKLPKATTEYLKEWLHAHADHPYPSEDEKRRLCAATGMSMSQVSNWMINARRRILAPAKMNAQVAAATFQRQQQAAAAQQQQQQQQHRPGTRIGPLTPASPMDSYQLAAPGYPAARSQFAYMQPTITYHNVPGQLPMSAPATSAPLSAYPFPQANMAAGPDATSTNGMTDANGNGTFRTAQQGTATPGCG